MRSAWGTAATASGRSSPSSPGLPAAPRPGGGDAPAGRRPRRVRRGGRLPGGDAARRGGGRGGRAASQRLHLADPGVGFSRVAHVAAVGKALLAACSPEAIDDYLGSRPLAPCTRHTLRGGRSSATSPRRASAATRWRSRSSPRAAAAWRRRCSTRAAPRSRRSGSRCRSSGSRSSRGRSSRTAARPPRRPPAPSASPAARPDPQPGGATADQAGPAISASRVTVLQLRAVPVRPSSVLPIAAISGLRRSRRGTRHRPRGRRPRAARRRSPSRSRVRRADRLALAGRKMTMRFAGSSATSPRRSAATISPARRPLRTTAATSRPRRSAIALRRPSHGGRRRVGRHHRVAALEVGADVLVPRSSSSARRSAIATRFAGRG